MALKSMTIGKRVFYWKLYLSLFLIFAGAVIASKFDSWCLIVGGALIAVLGCFLNQQSIVWLSVE
jgi:hypothetical protein